MNTLIENSNIVISLTTIPERLKCWSVLEKNLNSLLHQKTDREYRVILTIPYLYVMNDNEEYMLPNELLEFVKDNPKLIINRDTYDYGPIIKIIGALKYATDPNDVIIALDDDHIYHEDMLEYHLKKLNQYPNYAICFNGDRGADRRNWIDENGIKKYALFSVPFFLPPLCDHHLLVPGHWHSVSYRRSFFEDDFDENVWTLSDGDDLVMGYYLIKHGRIAICAAWDKETDNRPIATYGRVNTCFPIVTTLTYPYMEMGGNLIRTKYPGTNHGRVKQELSDFLNDLSIIYTEK